MSKYFRATGYYPKEDISFIVDSNGKFTERWELGAFLVKYGCKVIAINDYEQIQEVDLTKANADKQHLIARVTATGEPLQTITGGNKTLQVGEMRYAVK